jgi:alpha-glucosidase
MYLIKHNGVLKSQLSPLPGQDEIKVKADLPHHSPWRVLMISDRIGALIESNILTSLNEPCKIKDISWIKTGKTTFPWWNGSIIPDTSFAPGNNFENNKYYIDFCARNGLEFHSVVESNGHEWYTNDGEGYQPGPNADVTMPVPVLICNRYVITRKRKAWVYGYGYTGRLCIPNWTRHLPYSKNGASKG